VPGIDSAVYSGTKFAVRAIAEGMRQELRAKQSPIRVSCVSPGYVETEFAEVFSGSKEAAQKTYARLKCGGDGRRRSHPLDGLPAAARRGARRAPAVRTEQRN
jgi:NAD(P)-dependent dehydrogenase (short-subunit alcohol dehydrogenase family)